MRRPPKMIVVLIALLVTRLALAENIPVIINKNEFIGYTYSLISKKNITTYSFGKRGVVGASFGKVGGGVASPIAFWHIENGDAIVITPPAPPLPPRYSGRSEQKGEPKTNVIDVLRFMWIRSKCAKTEDGRLWKRMKD